MQSLRKLQEDQEMKGVSFKPDLLIDQVSSPKIIIQNGVEVSIPRK
jgi:hypothetical protein